MSVKRIVLFIPKQRVREEKSRLQYSRQEVQQASRSRICPRVRVESPAWHITAGQPDLSPSHHRGHPTLAVHRYRVHTWRVFFRGIICSPDRWIGYICRVHSHMDIIVLSGRISSNRLLYTLLYIYRVEASNRLHYPSSQGIFLWSLLKPRTVPGRYSIPREYPMCKQQAARGDIADILALAVCFIRYVRGAKYSILSTD